MGFKSSANFKRGLATVRPNVAPQVVHLGPHERPRQRQISDVLPIAYAWCCVLYVIVPLLLVRAAMPASR